MQKCFPVSDYFYCAKVGPQDGLAGDFLSTCWMSCITTKHVFQFVLLQIMKSDDDDIGHVWY
jgi:hypothetical protein